VASLQLAIIPHWEYRAGRSNVADPLSRHPLVVAHMMLCALEDGMDEGLMTDSDIVADILAGYANDPWFAEEANIAKEGLRLESGAYFKGTALVVPNIAAVRAGILQELHDSNYAGHVGIHRTIYNVKRIYWWPDMGRHIREYVQGAMYVSATRTCKGNLLKN
jgi:hypothetical protein